MGKRLCLKTPPKAAVQALQCTQPENSALMATGCTLCGKNTLYQRARAASSMFTVNSQQPAFSPAATQARTPPSTRALSCTPQSSTSMKSPSMRYSIWPR